MSRSQNFVLGESVESSGSRSETLGGPIEKPTGHNDRPAAQHEKPAAPEKAAAPPEKPAVAHDKAPELSDPGLFVNRELSWLSFNRRVLDQCFDATWPLLERVKFLAIHGSNLDEFFMVRVPGLHDQVESGVTDTAPDGMTAREQLDK